MNIFLWILQVLLALHTATGAIWKFSNSQQSVPSLAAIPHTIWISLSVVEILCAVGLVLPAIFKSLGLAAPVAAGLIAAEMLMFCALHLRSGTGSPGELVYWLIVAGVCSVVVYGRIAL